jgi:hypothetical protein
MTYLRLTLAVWEVEMGCMASKKGSPLHGSLRAITDARTRWPMHALRATDTFPLIPCSNAIISSPEWFYNR